MSESNLALVGRVSRSIRYQTIDELIGLEVTISDIDSIADCTLSTISEFTDAFKPEIAQNTDLSNITVIFSKYAFADLKFREASVKMSSVPVGGISFLKQLGFVWTKEELAEYSPTEQDVGCAVDLLSDLDEDISENNLYMLILLIHPLHEKWSEPGMINTFADRISVPFTMKIADACLANSPFVWFHRHFYL